MQTDQEARLYVLKALESVGAKGVGQYASLLAATPADRVINGLDPWAFLPTPEKSQTYCNVAADRLLLPFAQAVGEDMIACFTTEPGGIPGVVVINPWASSKAQVMLAELPHFEAWLAYAKDVSLAVQARERDEADDD